MKVLRGQEANLESRKGFCKGNRSFVSYLCQTSMPRIHENLYKLAEFHETYVNPSTTLKYDESLQRTRNQPVVEVFKGRGPLCGLPGSLPSFLPPPKGPKFGSERSSSRSEKHFFTPELGPLCGLPGPALCLLPTKGAQVRGSEMLFSA